MTQSESGDVAVPVTPDTGSTGADVESSSGGSVKQPGPLVSFLAGGGGGICLVAVGHPLDTIKVKLQIMKIEPGKPPPYTGVLDVARQTIAEHGPQGQSVRKCTCSCLGCAGCSRAPLALATAVNIPEFFETRWSGQGKCIVAIFEPFETMDLICRGNSFFER